ncbi:PAS domain-containing sensor histidine kinase [Mucilaginibacter sp. KACC 22773]|uniref:PAS domain-containing sensor histidine kinase n=1 Tax=Mucilaginibacter sp. KACC 22773 TaxID=3025671 RepID=UPI002366414B|nr:PAS domain-containing sensor histidine kinase [Mucilaginibacter sp. KACC 22773]WDF81204.1 PAS domain-containing sensor histidine kinase [Mucilaginibacter sp. KACC 22773]
MNLIQRTGKSNSNELEHELSVHEIELQMQNAELLEIQEKLNTALLEYSELFELSPVGYFILDKNGIIEKVNVRASIQLGIDKEQLINKPFSTFLHTERDQDNFYRHMNIAVEEGTLGRMECEIKKKDGAVFFAFIKSKVIKDEKLRFKHLLSMVTDITKLKEHEHQIEIQLAKTEELSIMKSRFIGMASHEFRTPLTSMLSSTTLIGQYAKLGETGKMERYLTRIKSSIKNLVVILDEFLSIEKLESENVEIQRANFDLPGLCEDMMEEVSATKKKGQQIHHSHTGNNEIKEDRKIIQHILLNLLSNACKYSAEEKEIKLLTTVTDYDITITVEDQGIGIPEAEQANIFARFFRAGNTGNIQGTGLGLNIVKRYVELLDGNIEFVCKQNEGTTFRIQLPLKQSLPV